MNLPKLAIKNYQFTIIIVILLIASGIMSLLNMPRSENPPVGKPGTSIIIIYPGADPLDMEKMITTPIEEAVNELDDLKKINSKSQDGLAVIQVEFLAGSDPDEKFSDVNEKINSIKNELPADIHKLILKKWTIEDTNFLQIALTSESLPYKELENLSDGLKKSLEKVKGIRKVNTWGYPEQEVKISIDTEKLSKYVIPLDRILNILKSENINIPGGSINSGGKKFNIISSGFYDSIEEIKNTIIHSDGQKVIYLKNLAKIYMDYEDEKHIARYNKSRAVFVTANQKKDTNIFKIMEDVNKRVKIFNRALPSDVKLSWVYDQSIGVDKKLSNFFMNMLQGILLVGIVIFLVIGFRGSFIVMAAIPISIFIALGFVDLSGYGIEQMSIAGLVITLGLLVDNAIVVIENISRFLKMGETRLNAAIKGSKEIGWPIVSATATTILAFLPIAMMQDVSGDFIRSMPITVIFTLTASLFIALTLTPYLSSKLLVKEKKESKGSRVLQSFISNYYSKWLKNVLNKPKSVIAISLILLLASLSLFPIIGISFFPKADKYEFFIDIKTPEGSNIYTTDKISREIETLLLSKKEVHSIAANVGRSNPQIFYNIIEKQGKPTFAQIFVNLKEIGKTKMGLFIKELRKSLSEIAGAKIEVKELEQGPPVNAPVEIKILGKKNEILKDIAIDIEKTFIETAGLININNPLATTKNDIEIKIDKEKVAMYGVSLIDIDRTIRMNIAGIKVSNFRDNEGKDYNIIVRADYKNKNGTKSIPSIKTFEKIYINSIKGASIPLSQLADIKFKNSSVEISRYNLERSVSITADVLPDISVNKVTIEIEKKMKSYKWPSGYSFHVGGEKEKQEESFGGMSKAVLIAIVAILAILILQFKSFLQPMIVFAALPLAIIGSILALLITGYSFSFTAFIGLTSLIGIVINNSIILVDYTNQLIAEGKDLITALIQAGETRFTPIILTTLTTIGGLLPLTLQGGALWGPMGWTIIGGLISSTFLTLIIVPVLYKVFTKEEI